MWVRVHLTIHGTVYAAHGVLQTEPPPGQRGPEPTECRWSLALQEAVGSIVPRPGTACTVYDGDDESEDPTELLVTSGPELAACNLPCDLSPQRKNCPRLTAAQQEDP